MEASGNLQVATPSSRTRSLRFDRLALLRLVSLVVILVGWQLLSLRTTSFTLPGPLAVLWSAARLLVAAPFWTALLISLQSLVLGYLIAAVLGVGVGILVGSTRRLGPILDVYLYILLAVPVAGIIPVVVMALGVGLAARLTVVVFFSVVIIAVNTATGVRQADATLLEMARSFGVPRGGVFRRIVLPGALPAMMAGFRLGVGRAIVGMVTSELILLSVGMGKLIDGFESSFRTDDLIATLLLLVLLGVLSMNAVQRVERRLTRWYR